MPGYRVTVCTDVEAECASEALAAIENGEHEGVSEVLIEELEDEDYEDEDGEGEGDDE